MSDVLIVTSVEDLPICDITMYVDGAVEDPTSGTVDIAIIPSGEFPEDADWLSGSWSTNATGSRTIYTAMLTTTKNQFEVGKYKRFVRITSGGEAAVKEVPGLLSVDGND